MGLGAVLVSGIDDPAGWALGLRRLRLEGVVDVVPAAETVLVTCTDATALAALHPNLDAVVPVAVDGSERPVVTIPVRYDGADLDDVAAVAGISVDDVVASHVGVEYVAAFCGFSPGFAYLAGLPSALHLPRRASPRARVPAGSVAIANGYSAVYPRASPGGWHLLGSTDAVLFDARAERPALVQPGDRVRFEPC
ncbi:MAG TPA: allophanate hydrolase subunit 1 [Ilumatobacter sp.]|nr:allophanate hydrolase subunit 1 [Ilumatobacter sp.]